MPGRVVYQSLTNKQGTTLIEALIAIVLMVMMTSAVVGLFAAGLKSFTYSTRQTNVLTNARQAMDAGSSKPGMAWQARQGLAVSALSVSQLGLTGPGGILPQYSLSGQTLSLVMSGVTTPLAKEVTALQFAYYNTDASGLIIVSTSAAAASLMTAWMQTQKAGQKTYTFYSAARLRNHT